MKVEIIDLKKIKLIAENKTETLIMSNWNNGVFKYRGGKLSNGILETTYKNGVD